jgi:plasmid stabilization system protein ParE
MPYRLSGLAEQDLEEIWLYVAEDACPTTADRLIDAIVERLISSPNSLPSDAYALSSRPAYGRSLSRATSSTTGRPATS